MSTTNKRLVALSAGGNADELAAHGLGIEHIDELLVRLAKALLKRDDRLAFGGVLNVPDAKLTQHLIDAVQHSQDQELTRQTDATDPDTWPLVNYAAWPRNRNISAKTRAENVGTCHFVDVYPRGVALAELEKLEHEEQVAGEDTPNSLYNRYVCDALSAMRERSTQDADARFVMGGKIKGASGWMPGILEEVGYSLDEGQPILVFGGFGGCAAAIAEYLRSDSADWPEELTHYGEDRKAELGALGNAEEARFKLNDRFKGLIEKLTEFRAQLHSAAETVNGIETAHIRQALKETNARKAIKLAVAATEAVGRP